MSTHPNRGRTPGAAATPTPEAIRAARGNLTQTQAAALIYSTLRTWQDWEAGERRMHPGLFELFQIKTTQAQ